ncbi:uncharacterized protein LOC131666754 [Phymastichus coffea]|uniref:uncharacterized protein LOC131666754 n=1 Tax=Phymastichus coffea TaxID=108790 RepID=UPI00273B6EA6|nr:uncharacterized protein LOC131666754 [Phymastichus coffea]
MARCEPYTRYGIEVIVDIQAFKFNDQTIIKEPVLVNLNDDHIEPAHWVFSPSCLCEKLPSYSKRENSWLTANIHGIDWNVGNIPYDIQEIGRLAADTDVVMIYVKDRHKVQ